jgi:tetratricopeptide (TPR) repeat protein
MLCVLPTIDAELIRELENTDLEEFGELQEIWVFNHRPGGLLAASQIARHFQMDRVFATDPKRPVDWGFREASPVAVEPIPDERTVDGATLERVDEFTHVYRASFEASEIVGVIGLGMPMRALLGPPLASVAIGGVEFGGVEPEQLNELVENLKAVMLVETGTGLASKVAEAFSWVGVDVFVFGAPWVESADSDLLEAAAASDSGALAERAEGCDAVALVATSVHLIARGELESARRLLDAALPARGECGALWFQLGVLEFLSENLEASAEAYRKAADAERPLLEARVNLALTYVELGRGDDALEVGLAALEASPLDPLVVDAALLVLAGAKRKDEAAKVFKRHGSLLGPVEQGIWSAIFESGKLPDISVVHRFAAHAQLLLDESDGLISDYEFEKAEPLLRRALVLDPQSLGAYAELGVALAGLKRDEDAIALYREGITSVPGGELLRYNLANRCQELGRHEEAIAEYRRCVELKPDWWAAQIQLIQAYAESGKADASETERKRFLAKNPPEDALNTLNDLVGAPKSES